LLVAIAKKKCNSGLTLYEILQILSVSPFDKTPINQLLRHSELQSSDNNNYNQLNLFDLYRTHVNVLILVINSLQVIFESSPF